MDDAGRCGDMLLPFEPLCPLDGYFLYSFLSIEVYCYVWVLFSPRIQGIYRCKNTRLSEHHARKSTFFLSRDVESTERMALGCDVHNAME
jgi:hypothetical protein